MQWMTLGPFLATGQAQAADLYVGSGQPYATAMAAYRTALAGDTIWVGPGTDNEHFTFDTRDSITIRGDGGFPVFSRGGGDQVVTVDGVELGSIDGMPNDCDACASRDDSDGADFDGCDICDGGDELVDTDGDGTSDDCEPVNTGTTATEGPPVDTGDTAPITRSGRLEPVAYSYSQGSGSSHASLRLPLVALAIRPREGV